MNNNAVIINNISEAKEGMEIMFFVGFHDSVDGFGIARIKSISDNDITISVRGDFDEWSDDWVKSHEEFNGDLDYLKFALNNLKTA